MRILLINPPFRRMTGIEDYYYPIGLAYLAAVAKGLGHEVGIFDVERGRPVNGSLNYMSEYRQMEDYITVINDDGHPLWQEVVGFLRDFKPDLVGIRAQTTTYASAVKVAELVKRVNPGCLVIKGGPHPSIKYEQVLEDENVDFVVRDEGEITFSELIKTLEDGNGGLGGINGLSYKLNGRIVNNPPREFIKDIDSIPQPSRESLFYLGHYTPEDLGVLMASRGCPFSCSFCFNMWQKKLRCRSVENVIEEIVSVKERYKTQQFSFKDDTFTMNKAWVSELCEKLLGKGVGINWDCTSRVDLLDKNLLTLMKRAGCNVIKIGVESGSERILKDLKKGVSVDEIRRAAKLINDNNIFWSAYFIVGLPQETKEDMQKTYNFMREINAPYASIGLYKAFPNTTLFSQGVEMDILKPDMEREEYLRVKPLDYYYKNPKKRTLALNNDEFNDITQKIISACDAYNKRIGNLLRRGFARKAIYLKDPLALKRDLLKVKKWIGF
ncbi:MAG: radical SAM protein [Candidatus Brocadiaceae bacterium]|nr:radical SAM protein [Candidatus Brocadiaceae bacterium]